ncbi:hypothetical protein [Streptomyces sp. NPDC053367]|uniref:hypothetical protein n=1 Tax=Streptomyces sp. NPDC053367 TaxID=3365700 RepID=UPI0037D949DE
MVQHEALTATRGSARPCRDRAGGGRPRGHEHLADDVAALRADGTGIVVCALPDAERTELGLADEHRLAGAAGSGGAARGSSYRR